MPLGKLLMPEFFKIDKTSIINYQIASNRLIFLNKRGGGYH